MRAGSCEAEVCARLVYVPGPEGVESPEGGLIALINDILLNVLINHVILKLFMSSVDCDA